jgi:hypothetical protein
VTRFLRQFFRYRCPHRRGLHRLDEARLMPARRNLIRQHWEQSRLTVRNRQRNRDTFACCGRNNNRLDARRDDNETGLFES